MAIDSTHPLYDDKRIDWEQMNHTFGGSRAIKDQGLTYLPATDGMISDGMQIGNQGLARYEAYKLRSHYPDFVETAITSAVGLMHSKPPIIELPARMEKMRNSATLDGESLEALLRMIHTEQLKTGRLGLLVDVPTGQSVGEVVPYIALYNALAIRNWDWLEDFTSAMRTNIFVVLDESRSERTDGLDFEFTERFRVLTLGDHVFLDTALESGLYATAIVLEDDKSNEQITGFITPRVGSTALDFIPFTFVNSSDLVFEPDKPPFLALSDLSLTVYRGEADYRQSLFLQGQDTFVVSGGGERNEGEATQLGAGAQIFLDDPQASAKFVGHESKGIMEQRESLENDRLIAGELGARLLDTGTQDGRASGRAMGIRVAARTTTLTTVALTGAAALKNSLKQSAIWLGLNPEDVNVTPNLDFDTGTGDSQEIINLQAATNQGFPLSQESLHEYAVKNELTTKTFEEELEAIETEEPRGVIDQQPTPAQTPADDGINTDDD